MNRFFSYDPDDGQIEFWKTETKAREAAESILDRWRTYAVEDGEWPDDADQICWGEIRQIAQDATPDEASADYQLGEPT